MVKRLTVAAGTPLPLEGIEEHRPAHASSLDGQEPFLSLWLVPHIERQLSERTGSHGLARITDARARID